MREPLDSWWIKLKRAEKHLTELSDYTARYSEVRPYDTTVEVHRDAKSTGYIVRAFLNDPPDYTPSVIVGDCIHDIRSALDHIIAFLTEPEELRKRSAFPIYEENIWQPGFKSQRESFKAATEGLPEYALAFVEQVQPYHRGQAAPDDPLAVLKALSNADKHRELIVVARALHEPGTGLRWEPDGPVFVQHRVGEIFENGAVIANFPIGGHPDTEPQVHSHGAVSIAIKRQGDPGDYLPLPDALESLLKYVWEYVILPLDTFTPS